MSTTPSAFDFLLGDLSTVPTDHKVVKKEPVNALDWLCLDNTDVSAPHPDAFDLELETSLAALGGFESAELAALQSLTTTVDSFNPADFGLFSQYRTSANTTYSAYSGYGGAPSTITASSETLSTYGSQYEPYEHKIPTASSAVLDTVAAVSNSGAQHHHIPHTTQSGNIVNNLVNPLSSLFPDIDLNFTAFNLGAVAATAAENAPNSSMLPRLTLDIDSTSTTAADSHPRSTGSSSAYDAASASPPSADIFYPLPPTSTNVSPSYMGSGPAHPSLAGGLTSRAANNIIPKAETTTHVSASEVDPRRKYQCPSCPRAFARAFNLKTHMATHDPNRIKSFVCRHSGCGRSFSRKHDLGRHLVSIHQDTSVIGTQAPATSPTGNKRSSPTNSIGVGAGDKQRVWCDNCGRGWLAGSRDSCDCEGKEDD